MARIQLKRGLDAALPSSGMLAGEPIVALDRGTLYVGVDATTKIPVVPAIEDLTELSAIDRANDCLIIHDASATGAKEKKITVSDFRDGLGITGIEAVAEPVDPTSAGSFGQFADSTEYLYINTPSGNWTRVKKDDNWQRVSFLGPNIPAVSVETGDGVSFSVADLFTGLSRTYALSDAPSWLSINANGLVTGTATTSGIWSAKVIVTSGTESVASNLFSVTSIAASVTPSAIFTASEPGVWFDPSDLSTLYQDYTGRTPVTGVEQPVGLMLDKSRPGTGVDLLSGYNFTNWTKTSGTVTANTITLPDTNGGGVYKSGLVTVGHTYKVIITATIADAYGIEIRNSDAGYGGALLIGFRWTSGTGTFTGIFTAENTGLYIRLPTGGAAGRTATITEFKLIEMPGYHASQSTDASRPTLSARYNMLVGTNTLANQSVTVAAGSYVLSFSGTGSVTLSGAATGSKSAGANTFTATAGSLNLSVSGTVTNAQLVPSYQSACAYQAVTSATVYNYDKTKFPWYLKFTDHCLSTATINATSYDTLALYATIGKASSTSGVVIETSASSTSNNGTIAIFAPYDNADTLGVRSRGTGQATVSGSGYAVPGTFAISATADISTDTLRVEFNDDVVTSSTDQGTGNYGNYNLYIGRRGGTTIPFNGQIYGITARFASALPDTTTRDGIKAYFKSKAAFLEDEAPPDVTYAPLKTMASNKGLIYGAAISWSNLFNDATMAAAFATESGLLVPEADAKMNFVRPTSTTFHFSGVDQMQQWAASHGMLFRYHTLIWHLSNPSWFETTVNSSNADSIMSYHITNVCNHYAGKVHSYDVVNEAVAPWTTSRSDGLRESKWLQNMGTGYIDKAFRYARAADPHALLVLNQDHLEYDIAMDDACRAKTLTLLQSLVAGGTPIDVLGIESHLCLAGGSFSASKFRSFLSSVSSLGLKIMITELDVTDKAYPSDITTRDNLVADRYAEYLSVCLENPDVIAILTWGISDRYTWIETQAKRADGLAVRPLPMDTNFVKKPAYYRIADAFWNY